MATIELFRAWLVKPEDINLEFKTVANQFSRDKHLPENYNVQLIMDNCQLSTSVVPILGTVEISKENYD